MIAASLPTESFSRYTWSTSVLFISCKKIRSTCSDCGLASIVSRHGQHTLCPPGFWSSRSVSLLSITSFTCEHVRFPVCRVLQPCSVFSVAQTWPNWFDRRRWHSVRTSAGRMLFLCICGFSFPGSTPSCWWRKALLWWVWMPATKCSSMHWSQDGREEKKQLSTSGVRAFR